MRGGAGGNASRGMVAGAPAEGSGRVPNGVASGTSAVAVVERAQRTKSETNNTITDRATLIPITRP